MHTRLVSVLAQLRSIRQSPTRGGLNYGGLNISFIHSIIERCTVHCRMVWQRFVKDSWPPKRPGPASDRDNVTRQTLRAGIYAPLPRNHIYTSGHGRTRQQLGRHLNHTIIHPAVLGSTCEQVLGKTPTLNPSRCAGSIMRAGFN